jgi:hypothetical protein
MSESPVGIAPTDRLLFERFPETERNLLSPWDLRSWRPLKYDSSSASQAFSVKSFLEEDGDTKEYGTVMPVASEWIDCVDQRAAEQVVDVGVAGGSRVGSGRTGSGSQSPPICAEFVLRGDNINARPGEFTSANSGSVVSVLMLNFAAIEFRGPSMLASTELSRVRLHRLVWEVSSVGLYFRFGFVLAITSSVVNWNLPSVW